MTWLERVETEYKITTGDGKVYTPQWLNAARAVEYNIAAFDFVDTDGTLVIRKRRHGQSYPLEIYFQGEEHLTTAEAFFQSASDPRPWRITHPFYGALLVQPVGLVFENQDYNVTRITGTLLETLSDTPNVPEVAPADKIAAGKIDADKAAAEAYVTTVPAPKAKDIKAMIENLSGSYNAIINTITETTSAQQVTNVFNLANAAAGGAITNTLAAISSTQAAVGLPFQLAGSVINRLQQLGGILNYLVSSINPGSNPSEKRLFEATAAAVVSGAAAATYINPGGYVRRGEVLEAVSALLAINATYTGTLSGLQTANGGAPSSYIPSAVPLTALADLVSYTVTSLLTLAGTTKQERTVFLEEESNVILQVQRFYGKGYDDALLNDFIATNNIGLNEFIGLRKGRQLTYYV